MPDNKIKLYEIFVRSRRGLSHQHVGSVYASDTEHALELGRDCYLRRAEGTSVWAVPASEIRTSDFNDVSTFHDPMEDKEYRKAEHYHIPEEVKNL